MSNNIKRCSFSFEYEEEAYTTTCWNLLQANFNHKPKEYSVIGKDWRQLMPNSGTSSYSMSFTSIMRKNKIYGAIIAISNSNEPHTLIINIGDKLRLNGLFIINKIAVEVDKSGLLHMKINIESHGEIKNDYNIK